MNKKQKHGKCYVWLIKPAKSTQTSVWMAQHTTELTPRLAPLQNQGSQD